MFRWIATGGLVGLAGCILTVPIVPPDSGASASVCSGALLSAPVDARLARAVVGVVRAQLGGEVTYEIEAGAVTRGPGGPCGYDDVDAATADEERFRAALITVDPGYADAGSLVDACPCRSDGAHQTAAKEAPALF